MNKFTYFDVETPNRNNDRICSMGIIHVVDGQEILKKVYLVNPETYYSKFNIEIHGITPKMTEKKPSLKQLWPEIESYFTDSVIVAHNALFDLGVLTKTLHHYGIVTPNFNYICTLEKAKRHLGYRRNSLDYLCATFGILMDRHHEALSDAKACMDIFYYLVERHGLSDAEISVYHLGKRPRGLTHNAKESDAPHLEQSLINLSSAHQPDSVIDSTPTLGRHQFKGKNFCLTGDFKFGTKYDIENVILARGGITKSNLTHATDYLVIGSLGSPKWSYGTYGTKVKKAKEMQTSGHKIQILTEDQFLELCKLL